MALVVTMLALLVLTALTGALLPLTMTEVAIAANHRAAAVAHYGAEAAAEWTIQELQAVRSLDPVLAGRVRSARSPSSTQVRLPGGRVFDLQRATAELERFGAGSSGAGRGLEWRLYAAGPLRGLMPSDPSKGLLSFVVWIADDLAEIDGDSADDSNGTVVLQAATIGPTLAQRAVQVIVGRPRGLEGVDPDEEYWGGEHLPPLRVMSWNVVR
jgi:type II secretory pathway component PulK